MIEKKIVTAWDKVQAARKIDRTRASAYVEGIFDDFFELHGDRCFGDDKALLAGVGSIDGMSVTILAQNRGMNLAENLDRNYGMMHPEGYRKALRLAKQAEKYNRPIINIVDTSGAYPGMGAEERGQALVIAECLETFSALEVPVLSFVIGEGGSGGALALSVADKLYMLENAVYSILSPEGFASILWKDGSRAEEAAEVMELTARDLLHKGIIDEIITEPSEGIEQCPEYVFDQMRSIIIKELRNLSKIKIKELIENRYQKYRKVGV